MKLHLTDTRAETLAGMLDVAVKAMGLRALTPDVIDLVGAVQAVVGEQQQAEQAVAQAAVDKHRARRA